MDIEEHWVDVDQVAAHLDVAKETVYRWTDKRNFPAHKAGRLLRFKISEVDDWVRQGGGKDSSADDLTNEPGRKEGH